MKTALITGANRGIGQGLAKAYLEAGWTVVGAAREPDRSDVFASWCEKSGERFVPVALDVADPASISAMAARLESRKLGLVINNAGISVEEAFGEWTVDHLEHHFLVNATGPALVAQAVVPLMNEGSKLINITSGMASLELNINPQNGLDAYAMSKAALNMMTCRLADKLKSRGITVAAVSPGWVQTEMGGAEAPVTVDQAVQLLTATIDSLGPEHSGGFYAEDGGTMPW